MIRLIATDIDGTLIPHYGELDPDIPKLIGEFRKRGVRFIAASGRQHPNLVRLFEPVSDQMDFICENGCLIFMDGKLVSRERMDRDLGHDMIDTIMKTPGAEVLVSGEEVSYVAPKDPSFEGMIRDVVGNDVQAVTDIMHTPEEYFKISAWIKEGVTDLTMQYWQGLFGEAATVVYAGLGWVDMMPKGVHKGTAIQKVMDMTGIRRDEVMAFGDNYNDEEMMSNVEYSYAMAKAPREIKDFAYGICTNVRDVLWETLQKIDKGERP